MKNAKTQTPIEISLQIDENGMTTASKLYAFLELHPAHFANWCRRNIKNNQFAVENDDYIVFTMECENPINQGGRPKTDYKLTSDFAKKLSMIGNTERHEQARAYFLACEKGLKIATQKLQSPAQANFQPLLDAMTALTRSVSSMQHDIDSLKRSQESIQKQIPKKRFSSWTGRMFPKYQQLMDYFDISRKDLYHHLFTEFSNTYPGIDLTQEQEDFCFEYNLDSCYTMDVIEHSRHLRKRFELMVDGLLEKYDLMDDNVTPIRKRTIFDEM